MTDTEHDNDKTEYEHEFEGKIPEGTDYIITSMPTEEFEEMTEKATQKALLDQEPQDHYHNYEDPTEIQKLLSPTRLQIITHLLEDEYESISHLADDLGRDYKNVHNDLELLHSHGIVKFREDGRKKQPYIPYKKVRVEMELNRASKLEA